MTTTTNVLFRDAVTVMTALTHVLADHLSHSGLVLTSEEREAGFDAHAKMRDAGFALLRMTDILDGVRGSERTPEPVRTEVQSRRNERNDSRLNER